MLFTVVLFVYALGLRAAHIVHDRRTRRLRELWWPIFSEALAVNALADIQEFKVSGSARKAELLREWCRFRSHVRGSSTANLNVLAEHLDLLTIARQRLSRHSVSNKLLAIQAVGYLRDRSSWPVLQEMLDSPNIAISITAAAALVNIDPEQAMPLIIPLIGKRARWPRTQVGPLLSLAGPDVVSRRLCDAIETAPTNQAVRLLQFTESADTVEVNQLVARLLAKRNEPALLSAALKALRGYIKNRTIEDFTRHNVWYVRMQAASLLGQFGRRDACGILELLLGDTEWWVRYRAAQAIVNLPFLGPNALRQIRDRQTDQFAKDIMQQALAERALV